MAVPKMPLYATASIVTSCVSLLFGLDTGCIGPVTAMESFAASIGHLQSTLHGVVVSSALLAGAITAFFTGIFADRYGRVSVICTGSAIFAVGAAVEAASTNLGTFIFGRVITGAGQGLFLSIISVQVGEMSPARRRGVLMSLPQLTLGVGLVSGYFICYGTGFIENSSLSWRIPLVIQSVLAVGFCVAIYFVPPSPRWLLAVGRVDQAKTVMVRLGIPEEEQRDILAHSAEVPERRPDLTIYQDLALAMKSFGEAFSHPYLRRTAFGCFVMAMQQFSGIDGVLYYAPTLFQRAGIASEQATFLASGISAILILVAMIPGTIFADSWGRRTSTTFGGSAISVLMLLMGSLYASNSVYPSEGAARWVVIVSIYLFAIIYAGTWGITFKIFLIESLPRKTRSSGASLGQCSNWMANYIVALTTPLFLASSSFGVYFFFAGCTMLCTLCCSIWMQETKDRSLEEIEDSFTDQTSGTRKATAITRLQLLKFRKKVSPEVNETVMSAD